MECKGYDHVQNECANTSKKNKSYATTWSNEEIEGKNEGGEVFVDPVALINMAIPKAISTTALPVDTSSCKSFASVSTVDELETMTIKKESDDEEEISNEEMVDSYKVMYEKLVDAVTENRGLLEQISLLNKEKGELKNQVDKLKDELIKQKESLNELEQIKKTLGMMNFGSGVLD